MSTSATPTESLNAERLAEVSGRQERRSGRRLRLSALRLPLISRLVLLVAILCYTLPLLYLLIVATKSDQAFGAHPLGLGFRPTRSNFTTAWREGGFAQLALNSVFYGLVGASLSCVIALFVAFPIARRYVPAAGFFQFLFVVALFLPNPLVAQYQVLLHLSLYNSRWGYLLLLVSTVGVAPLILIGYLRSVPVELDESAALDGVGYLRYVLTFVAPMARPALATAFMLQAITYWNEIIVATIVLADPTKSPVSKGLYAFSGPYGSNEPLVAAAALVVAGPLVLLYIALQRYIIAGATNGALKA